MHWSASTPRQGLPSEWRTDAALARPATLRCVRTLADPPPHSPARRLFFGKERARQPEAERTPGPAGGTPRRTVCCDACRHRAPLHGFLQVPGVAAGCHQEASRTCQDHEDAPPSSDTAGEGAARVQRSLAGRPGTRVRNAPPPHALPSVRRPELRTDAMALYQSGRLPPCGPLRLPRQRRLRIRLLVPRQPGPAPGVLRELALKTAVRLMSPSTCARR